MRCSLDQSTLTNELTNSLPLYLTDRYSRQAENSAYRLQYAL